MGTTILFPRLTMLDILYGECGKIISDTIVDKGRWTDHHELVFRWDDKLYITNYSEGSTEYQDGQPWEDQAEVVCFEAEECTVISYRKKE